MEDISNLYGKNKSRFLSELAEGSKRTNGQSVISHEQAEELRKRTGIDEIRRLMELNEKRGIRFLSRETPDYPKRLLILKDAPYGIYVKGAVPGFEQFGNLPTDIVKENGLDNNLLELIAADERFNLTLEDLKKTMDPTKYTGRSKEQVEEFLAEVIKPILDANKEDLGLTAEINV